MSEVITSPQNPRLKAAARLRDRRGRKQTGRIIIDGRREVAQALNAGVKVEEVFFCQPLSNSDGSRDVMQLAEGGRVPIFEVGEAAFNKIGYGQRTGGVVAVAQRPCRALQDIRLDDTPFVAVIEHVEKPGNLGAVFRSAEAAGVDAVIVVDPATDIYGPNVLRASLGTAFCLAVAESTVDEAIEWMKRNGFQIVAAIPDSKAAYTDVNYRLSPAVVFGSEAGGLTDSWNQDEIVCASVPMQGRVDSLNVSSTAALFFYEALRQRRECRHDPL